MCASIFFFISAELPNGAFAEEPSHSTKEARTDRARLKAVLSRRTNETSSRNSEASTRIDIAIAKRTICALTSRRKRRLMNLFDCCLNLFHDTRRQWRIAELGSHGLTVGDHPFEELSEDFPFIGVFGRNRN